MREKGENVKDYGDFIEEKGPFLLKAEWFGEELPKAE